jgi:hypothetical protein
VGFRKGVAGGWHHLNLVGWAPPTNLGTGGQCPPYIGGGEFEKLVFSK